MVRTPPRFDRCVTCCGIRFRLLIWAREYPRAWPPACSRWHDAWVLWIGSVWLEVGRHEAD